MNPNGRDNIYSIAFHDTYLEKIGVRGQTGDLLIGKVPVWHELPVWKHSNNVPWRKEGSNLPRINTGDKDKSPEGWIWDVIITGAGTPAEPIPQKENPLPSGDNLTPAHISVGDSQVCSVLFNGEDIAPSKRCSWIYRSQIN